MEAHHLGDAMKTILILMASFAGAYFTGSLFNLDGHTHLLPVTLGWCVFLLGASEVPAVMRGLRHHDADHNPEDSRLPPSYRKAYLTPLEVGRGQQEPCT